MNTLTKRILIHGGIVVVGLSIFGVMFAQIAGVWVQSQVPHRPDLEQVDGPSDGQRDEMQNQLMWRVPATMASMGFGLVVVFELLGNLWKKKPEKKPETTRAHDEEMQLQKLLKDAEQNMAITPPPVGQLPSDAVSEDIKSRHEISS